jgi:pterin-4a-carbinolamine dehydratase
MNVSSSERAPSSVTTDGGAAAPRATKPHGWRRRQRPLRLECRHQFPDYDTLRDFLDRAAELSEATGIHPNLSFGRDYVNMTLLADDAGGALTPEIERFAQRIDDIVTPPEDNGS